MSTSHSYDRGIGKSGRPAPFSLEKEHGARIVIRALLDQVDPEHVIIAYSGGKDSIAAAKIATEFGIRDAVCEESFCFQQQKADFRKTAEQLDLSVTYKSILSWDWLGTHPQFLHQPLSRQAPYYALRQHRSVQQEAMQRQKKAIVWGRRTEENTVKSAIYRKADGMIQCHPLRDWSTEEVWAYLRHYNIHTPSLYEHRIGKVLGNGPSNRLPPGDFPDPWEAIFSYEPAMMQSYAEVIPSARKWLERRSA